MQNIEKRLRGSLPRQTPELVLDVAGGSQAAREALRVALTEDQDNDDRKGQHKSRNSGNTQL